MPNSDSQITETTSNKPDIPKNVKVGDIIVGRYTESEWYCSLLVYKSYSRTVTNMYLEDYENGPGFYVLPDDLVNSKRTEVYHRWFKNA